MPIEFLMLATWAWEHPVVSRELLAHAKHHRDQHPRHSFYFLCNTPAQEAAFAAARWPVATMNSNMFVDEQIFRPLPDAEIVFDAVYNTRFSPDKRLEFAVAVERLCLVYLSSVELTAGQFHAEHARLQALMPKATFLNRQSRRSSYRRRR